MPSTTLLTMFTLLSLLVGVSAQVPLHSANAKALEATVDAWLDEYDLDDDQMLNAKEVRTMLRATQSEHQQRTNTELGDDLDGYYMTSFKQMDLDGNKQATRGELMAFMQMLKSKASEMAGGVSEAKLSEAAGEAGWMWSDIEKGSPSKLQGGDSAAGEADAEKPRARKKKRRRAPKDEV